MVSARVGAGGPQSGPFREPQGQVEVLHGLGSHTLAQVVEGNQDDTMAMAGSHADIRESAAVSGCAGWV